MLALQPLQVERPDLAHSTETVALAADAAGEVDIGTRETRAAAERRELRFRMRKETSMRGGEGGIGAVRAGG